MDINTNVSKEELEAEQNALKELKEEEIKAEVISEYGFDEIDDAERIDKVVKKELDNRKKLSQAIGQKIKIRTERDELKNNPPKIEPKKVESEEIDKVINATLEKRDLEALEYSDDIKNDITQISKTFGISVKKAAEHPYVLPKIESWKNNKKAVESAIIRTNRAGGGVEISEEDAMKIDVNTKEGQEEFDRHLQSLKKQL